MKTIHALLIVIFLTSLISCKKDDPSTSGNIEVETYIELLKTSQYDSIQLPAFTEQDIPALLSYRNETQRITGFPPNPISSMYLRDCKLGIYVLWTIESIRAKAINSPYLVMGFPSLNPILVVRNSSEFIYDDSEESHQAAADAYFNWWNNNKEKDFDEFKNIDPLADTDYKWH